MTKQVKIVKVGNSAGVILPKDVLARLHVAPGDELYLRETPNGGYVLTAVDPDFVDAMAEADVIMREDRDILAVLAK